MTGVFNAFNSSPMTSAKSPLPNPPLVKGRELDFPVSPLGKGSHCVAEVPSVVASGVGLRGVISLVYPPGLDNEGLRGVNERLGKESTKASCKLLTGVSLGVNGVI